MSSGRDADDARTLFLSRVSAAVGARTQRSAAPDYADEIAFARSAPVERAPAAAPPKAPVPEAPAIPSPLERFRERLTSAHGRAFTDVTRLGDWLLARGARHGYCDPLLAPALGPHLARAAGGPITLETTLDRARIDDYRFGITRAAGAIAETGTIILDDGHTSRRLGALAPWIHVAVLALDQIHLHVADAIAALGDDPNVIWCTGPSKTADVEGILIEGVHGPGEQIALILARPTAGDATD